MALKNNSLFLYSYEVNNTNNYLPFLSTNGGNEIDAIIPAGFYTLATLATAIAAAMSLADPANTYSVSVNRTISSNTQNRITISTSGAFLSILFASSPFASVAITSLINFGTSDLTGSTSYTNSSTTGTGFQTSWYGFNFQPPSLNLRTIGNVNLATDGTKEVIWWSVQQFLGVEYRYEPQAYVLSAWQPFMEWASKGRPFELTPEVGTPNTVYSLTLEKSQADGKGLGFMMKEMIPDFPFLYATGPLEMRLVAGTY